jgi:transcriptional regulator with GAF, ATPase, and Fis domain
LRRNVASDGAAILVHQGERLSVAAASGSGNRLEINDALARRVIADRMALATRGEGDQTWLIAAPLATPTTVLGTLYLSRASAPFDDDDLQLVAAIGRVAATPLETVRRLAAAQRDAERLQADLGVEYRMVGDSEVMRATYDRIGRTARTDATVLVLGETGTGKELAARAIHANSSRARHPFVAVNCAALTETLLESELFGHERGSFTGAVTQKKGKLEVADGGTLFLDEVGEMAAPLQSKLLRVLQEQEFERVGGTRPIRVDVRLISATNRSLSEEVAAGRFRQDLYFRLNVVSLEMPPLRARRGDISLLARHFLERHARKAGRRVTGFSPDALAMLADHPWPGNVRELENAIERAIVLGSTEDILPDDLPEDVLRRQSGIVSDAEELDFHGAVLQTKKRVIVAAFKRAGRSYVEAARLLHVHPNYLHRLIRNLDLKGELESIR